MVSLFAEMSGIKKKWTKSTNKEKRDWAPVLLQEVADDLVKAVTKSKLITPAKLAERYKISLTVARHVLDQLVADGKMVCLVRSNTLRAYGTAGTVSEEPVEQQAKAQPTKKGRGK